VRCHLRVRADYPCPLGAAAQLSLGKGGAPPPAPTHFAPDRVPIAAVGPLSADHLCYARTRTGRSPLSTRRANEGAGLASEISVANPCLEERVCIAVVRA
jgi:hypothetical protein